MFWTRLFSSITILAITIAMVVLGGNYLYATIFIISLIGLMELNRIVKVNKAIPGFMAYAAGIAYYVLIYFDLLEYQMLLFIIFLLLLMFAFVFGFPKFTTEQIAVPYFSLFYVSILLSYIYQVRMLENGSILVWLIFIGAWGSDTCAYCIGILFGKHKVTPKLSPKKSLEGCIAGVVGAALIGFLFATAIKGQMEGMNNPQLTFAIIGAASSVLSQVGDLAASAIKRNHDIKDYGNLIPGHGGILDRFDSIIFTAPVVYYLAELL